jgi:Fur family ferric uptake transcriptional regulator
VFNQEIQNILATYEKATQAFLTKTKVRLNLFLILIGSEKPLTLSETHLAYKKKHKVAPDQATVYRNMMQFVDFDLVEVYDFGDGQGYFEIKNKEGHHHHIVCRQCKEISHLDLCKEKILTELVQQTGFKDIKHRLDFFGICPSCQ